MMAPFESSGPPLFRSRSSFSQIFAYGRRSSFETSVKPPLFFFSSGAVGSSSVRTVFILVESFVCWCLGSKVRVERVAMVSRVSVSVKNRRECERVISRVFGVWSVYCVGF